MPSAEPVVIAMSMGGCDSGNAAKPRMQEVRVERGADWKQAAGLAPPFWRNDRGIWIPRHLLCDIEVGSPLRPKRFPHVSLRLEDVLRPCRRPRRGLDNLQGPFRCDFGDSVEQGERGLDESTDGSLPSPYANRAKKSHEEPAHKLPSGG